jgi:hypothetical protein
MPTLAKAKLYEVTAGDTPSVVGEPTDVQFNPESLNLQLSNRIEGGRSSGRQARQFVGSSSNTFSLDLEFDTADEGTTEEPISVLERTSVLEKFIQPKTNGRRSSEQPAKLRFHWGNLIIDGVVESIDLELDHFASNGYPLHAKVTLKLKEQKIEFQFAERGGGEEQSGSDDQSQVAQALDDELPSQAASRLGFDPANWRDLGFDLGLGLSLEAGLELNFQAGISASLGLDIKAGINADIGLDIGASLGLDLGARFNAGHLNIDPAQKQQVSSSLALTKAGGITAANNQLSSIQANAASASTVSAFGLSALSASTRPVANSASASATTTSGRSARRSSPIKRRSILAVSADERATT